MKFNKYIKTNFQENVNIDLEQTKKNISFRETKTHYFIPRLVSSFVCIAALVLVVVFVGPKVVNKSNNEKANLAYEDSSINEPSSNYSKESSTSSFENKMRSEFSKKTPLFELNLDVDLEVIDIIDTDIKVVKYNGQKYYAYYCSDSIKLYKYE